AIDIQDMRQSYNEIIFTTPHTTAAFVAERAGQMALKTDHNILGVNENMAYLESEETGKKEYVFGSGGGDNLADVLKTKVLGRLALNQPYLDEHDLAP